MVRSHGALSVVDVVDDCAAKRLSHNPNTLEFWLEIFHEFFVFVLLSFCGSYCVRFSTSFFSLARSHALVHFFSSSSSSFSLEAPTLDVSRTTLFRAMFGGPLRILRLLNFGKQFNPNRFVHLQKERKKERERWVKEMLVRKLRSFRFDSVISSSDSSSSSSSSSRVSVFVCIQVEIFGLWFFDFSRLGDAQALRKLWQ